MVGYNFRGHDMDQSFLLPPSLMEWLPEDHLARFLMDAIEQFDLSDFKKRYRSNGQGGAAYHPAVMVGIVIYAYSVGMLSSRAISKACETDIAFRVLSRNTMPEHSTISRFRRAHRDALSDLFVQALRLCALAGLAQVGTIALDGTKIAAAASMDKNFTQARLARRATKEGLELAPVPGRGVEQVVADLLDAAEDIDAAEDQEYGPKRGDEPPAKLRGKKARQERLRAAKARLDEINAATEAEYQAKLQRRAERIAAGAPPGPVPKRPQDKARYREPLVNLTDPDSRSMRSARSVMQGFNAQAIANANQIILTADVCNDATDWNQMLPMLENLSADLAAAGITQTPGIFLADGGYCTEKNLEHLQKMPDTTGYVSTTRKDRPVDETTPGSTARKISEPIARMHETFTKPEVRALYKQRAAIIEPCWAGIKTIQGIIRFTRHGLANVRTEIRLATTAHNLRKLHAHTRRALTATPAPAPA